MSFASLLKPLLGPIITPVIDRLVPDKNAAREEAHALETALLAASTAAMEGQLKINQVEAAHPSVFVAGWRPAIGWVCAIGLGWEFIIRPFALFALAAARVELGELPALDSGELYTLVTGMLGIAAARTYEKANSVARSSWNK